jgi:hypothetical protein
MKRAVAVGPFAFSLSLLSLALAATLATPLAQASTWQFEYTGLNDPNAPPIISSAAGSFTGTDTNTDGLISRDEVTAMDFFVGQVVPSVENWVPLGFFVSSELSSFSYVIGTSDLHFTATGGEWHDAFDKTSTALHWSTGIGNFSYDLTSPGVSLHVYGDATASIAAAPVPEPGTYGLMLAGLAAVGLVARHRSRRGLGR